MEYELPIFSNRGTPPPYYDPWVGGGSRFARPNNLNLNHQHYYLIATEFRVPSSVQCPAPVNLTTLVTGAESREPRVMPYNDESISISLEN